MLSPLLSDMLVFSTESKLSQHTSNTTTAWRSIKTLVRLLLFSICSRLLIWLSIATFLYNNYKQALDILSSGPAALSQAMTDLKISDTRVFEEWREEEKVYLEGLQKEPIIETLEMEYYQKLVNLRASE